MTTHRGILTVILTTIWSLNSTTYSPAAPPPGKGKNQVKLSVTLTPSSIKEGEQAAGTVSHDNSDLSSPVEVTLTSSDPGQATLTSSDPSQATGSLVVTIPAGSASASFAALGVDDAVADGNQSVTITATAEGYQSAEANLTVTEPPVEYAIAEIPVPGNGTVWINGITYSGFVYGWFTDSVDGETVYRSGWIYDQLNGFYDLNQEVSLLTQVETLFGPDASLFSVVGMNSRGDVVGYVENASGIRKGYVIDTSLNGQFSPDPADWTMQPLPDFGSDYTYGRRVNEIGDVLGVYQRTDGTIDAYLYNPWLDTEQNPAPEMALGLTLASTSVELNNHAQVAGVIDGGTAFVYDPGNTQPQTFTDAEFLSINGLNDDGVFVGEAWTIETYAGGKKQRRGSRVAFRYTTVLEPLGSSLSKVAGVNTSGDVAANINGNAASEATIFHTGIAPDFTEQTLKLADLIADEDPLKSTFVAGSPDVFAISDRDGTNYSQAVVRLYNAPQPNVAVILTPSVP